MKVCVFIKNLNKREVKANISVIIFNLEDKIIFSKKEHLNIPPSGCYFDFKFKSREPLYLLRAKIKVDYEKNTLIKTVYFAKYYKPMQFLIYYPYDILRNVPTPFYVKVYRGSPDKPVKNAQIKIFLNNRLLLKGLTDHRGEYKTPLYVKEEKSGKMRIEVEKGAEKLETEFFVRVKGKEENMDVYITTDKPIYLPGQEVHIKIMVLQIPELKPVENRKLLLRVSDPHGNVILKDTLYTNEFGIAYKKFKLADDIRTGFYHIGVKGENIWQWHRIEVTEYELPKFGINIVFDKEYYTPNEKVEGRIECQYITGEPVAGGIVELKVLERWQNETSKITGHTDKEGKYKFSFTYPEDYYGVILELTVKDSSGFVVTKTLLVPFPRIKILPQGGKFVKGFKNKFYVLFKSVPNTPISTDLKIKVLGKEFTVRTDSLGIGEGEIFIGEDVEKIVFEISDKEERFKKTLRFNTYEGATYTVLKKRIYGKGEKIRFKIHLLDRSVNTILLAVSEAKRLYKRGNIHIISYDNFEK